MKRSSPHPFPTFLLIVTGMIAIGYGFWAVESGSWTSIVIAIGVFFLSFLGGFIRILQWRDHKNAQFIPAQPTTPPIPRSELKGTIYGLEAGNRYQVINSFTDFYGNEFEKGEELHFQTRHFLPYDGGHTIIFENRRLYLQEDKNKDILDNFSRYIIKIE
jgi:hypothetical protein